MTFPKNKILQTLLYIFSGIGIITFITAIVITAVIITDKNKDENNESTKIESSYEYKGNRINFSQLTYNKNNKIPNIFLDESQNIVTLEPETNYSLNLTFRDPVYISNIILYEKENKESLKMNRPKKIILRMNGNENEFFGDWIEYIIPENKMIHGISFREKPGFYSIFLIKHLSINIENGDHEEKEQYKFIINQIVINYESKPNLNPTMTVNQINNLYVNGKKEWNISSSVRFHTIRQLNVEELLNYEALLNLSYYSLLGDKEAEKMLFNYFPTGAHQGEFSSAIKAWFEMTKNYNLKENSRYTNKK